jgi:hypothetical protein
MSTSQQDEQKLRRATLDHDRRLREQGGTFLTVIRTPILADATRLWARKQSSGLIQFRSTPLRPRLGKDRTLPGRSPAWGTA